MRRPTRLRADLWVSRAVREKPQRTHGLEVWEVEQALFDDRGRFVVQAGALYAVYGRTFAGRYVLCLVRQRSPEESAEQAVESSVTVLRLVTTRDMTDAQRTRYQAHGGR
jgi:hypothetical protein